MDSYTTEKLKNAVNSNIIRKLLINYFISKGFETPACFHKLVCPCVLQDLTIVIPVLADKIELIPSVAMLNPNTGKAELEWNLFVLGWHRMFLGNTFHNDLRDLASQIRNGYISPSDESGRRQTTPRKIIHFIMRSLHNKEAGYIDLKPPKTQPISGGFMVPNNGSFYKKPTLM